MIRYTFIILIFLSFKIYAQKNEFNELISLFATPKKEIPLILAKTYFDFQPTERANKLLTGQIIVQTDTYLIVSTHLECNAKRNCVQSSITSFSNTGERIGTIAFERTITDCSFDDSRKSVYVSKELLVFKEVREKLDCQGDGSQIGVKMWLEFQPIREEGTFAKPYTDRKSLERENYIFSHRVFTEEELKEKTEEELAIIKNEIFAAHGYMFKKEMWQDYFESKSWYTPSDQDATEKLTPIEKKNIELIVSLKKHEDNN
ncbi:YARHG domain-containing protein [Aquimarina sp. RZ0]|uniref:YARHG domain-containing protein n=1 Tax=Aquimarina sp. RZ0 TaxID=2607730 RepID=UPI0011F398E2|nr:YARHG domain-containing protein [Aquimarina sp. RZ0]KAA1243918.1 YARHG domain-containing protein [Aquimarina sp. RZ0]